MATEGWSGNTSVVKGSTSMIHAGQEEFDKQFTELQELIVLLEKRLDYVLAPYSVDGTSKLNAPVAVPTNSPMAEFLSAKKAQIRDCCNSINQIINRLEL